MDWTTIALGLAVAWLWYRVSSLEAAQVRVTERAEDVLVGQAERIDLLERHAVIRPSETQQ